MRKLLISLSIFSVYPEQFIKFKLQGSGTNLSICLFVNYLIFLPKIKIFHCFLPKIKY